jgi:TonB-linked SusC/RagA family outer membrane protein
MYGSIFLDGLLNRFSRLFEGNPFEQKGYYTLTKSLPMKKNQTSPMRRGTQLLLLLLLFSSQLFSQNRVVTGKVTDAKDGQALLGVSIRAKGSPTGAQTLADGSFSISVPSSTQYLEISSVGYEPQEVSIGNARNLSIALVSAVASLEDVVVIGYGTQKRKDVTSAVTTVKAEAFNQGGARNALDLIQGKVAGLSITRTASSNPNSGVSVQLRGVTSITGNLSPLIVIDGIPGGNLDLLQQDDVESFDVLKDGSAAAIYGTRGNGGVILITTKKGKAGTPQYNYSNYERKEYMTRRPAFLTASEYRAKIADGTIAAQYGTGIYGYNTDFFDALINHDNLSQYHNFSASGGTANSNYRASIYYNDLQGIALMNNRKQYGARINVNQRGLNDKLLLQIDLATNLNKANTLGGGGWENQLNRIPTLSNFNPDGTYYYYPNTTNEYARLFMQTANRSQQTSSGNAKVTYEVIKGLRASLFGSVTRDSYIDNAYAKLASEVSINSYGGGGRADKSTTLNINYAFEPTVEYSATIAQKHTFTVLGGYSYQYNVSENFSVTNYGFVNDLTNENNIGIGSGLSATPPAGIPRASIGSGKSDDKLIAFFGRINYNFSDRYNLQLILRHEGSSRFGANNKWANFPAASVGWNMMKEKFMNKVTLFDNLKLRAGFGVTGNSGIPNYQSLVTLGTGGAYLNPDGTWRQTYGPGNNPNPDLKWEKKEEWNIGIDFSMLHSRFGGAIDLYQRTTKDLLYNYSTQLPPFIQASIYTNVGSMRSKGIELTLWGTLVNKRDLSWKMFATASHNSNKMLTFSNAVYSASFVEFGGIGGFGALGNAIRTVEGGDIGNFYGKRFAGFDASGKWLFYKADGKTTAPFSQISGADLTVIGNGIPKYYLSWTNDLTYKNFDFRVFFRGRFGYKILNTMDISYGNKIYLPNNVLRTAFTKNAQLNDTYQYSDYYLENGGFLKLDNVTLGYRFKLKTSYIRSLRVYVSGTNLATITKYTGNDPDYVNDTGLGAGIDGRGPYPSTRQYTIGVNLGL